ncbi:MAG: M20 family metallo-hydrolase [Clostridiaceae bacterium]|nr:M20 family metallo-hydrolase [Clostridiaceae bacterium]
MNIANLINKTRLKAHLEELALVGYHGKDGITRLPLMPDEREAYTLVKGYMEQAGLKTRFDDFGNLFGLLEGSDLNAPVVMSGSHIDTVINGGAYDGTVGTLSAIEVLQTIKENNIPHTHSLEACVFLSEESARFGGGTLGSKAYVGDYTRADLDRLKDKDGVALAQALSLWNFEPDKLASVKGNPSKIKCFVELHIEQSIILESNGIPIGIVDQIAAPTNMRLTIKGRAGHAGATPMELRRDAFLGAAEIALEIEKLANTMGKETVGTVGEIYVKPNAINVIPGEATIGIDIRDVTALRKDAVVERLLSAIGIIAEKRNLETELEVIARQVPEKTDKNIVDLIRCTCEKLKMPFMNITSGAYHDALNMARITDIGMIFVPSVNGISHAPEEFTPIDDIFRGAQVLSEVLLELAK